MSGAAQIGELSVKLADAALIAREKGDEVNALFFAIKAAETLALAKALGWKPDDRKATGLKSGGCSRLPANGGITKCYTTAAGTS